MSVSHPRLVPSLAATVLLVGSAWACAPAEPDAAEDAAQAAAAYVYTDSVSGIVLELPAIWRDRFHVADAIADPVGGLLHELTLHFVQEDASIQTEKPLLIARVFDRAEWQRIGNDSAAARYGVPVGGNETRTLVLRTAPDNPFTPATADALGYDSLMLALFDRPFRATVRTADSTGADTPDSAR
jgi:hypothetical protein